MRILHLADLHLGAGEGKGPQVVAPDLKALMNGVEHEGEESGEWIALRLRDEMERLAEIVRYVKDNPVDLVLCAGDVFDSRRPPYVSIRAFQAFVHALGELQVPIILISGNHDAYPTPITSPIDLAIGPAMQHVALITHFHDERRVVRVVRARNGQTVGIVAMPWIFPHLFHLQRVPLDQSRDQIIALLSHYAGCLPKDVPKILLAHISLAGAVIGNQVIAQSEHELGILFSPNDLLVAPWNYVALGHFHFYQHVNNRANVPMVYSGNIERLRFDEQEARKGFCVVDLRSDECEVRFVPLQARPWHNMIIDLTAIEPAAFMQHIYQRLDAVRAQLRGAVARLTLVVPRAQEAYVDRRELSKRLMGEYQVAMLHSIQMQTQEQAALPTLSEQMDWSAVREVKDREELLRAYFAQRGIRDAQHIERLVRRAMEILRSATPS